LKIERQCPWCRKTFHPLTVAQVYCSHPCAGASLFAAGRNKPPNPGMPRSVIRCACCGATFTAKARKTRFCSRACWKRSLRPYLTVKRFDRLFG
jgi:hypothetical protein